MYLEVLYYNIGVILEILIGNLYFYSYIPIFLFSILWYILM